MYYRKGIVSLVLTLVLNAPLLAQRKVARGRITKPSGSLKQTTDWIASKIMTDGTHTVTSSDGSKFTSKYELVKFNGCKFSFHFVFNTSRNGTQLMGLSTNSSLLLSDIDPARLAVKRENDSYYIKIFSLGDKNTFQTIVETSLSQAGKPQPLQTNQFGISFQSEGLAKQVAAAFVKAVSLCGNRKSPEELTAGVPMLPVEFKVGYHRNEKAIFLSLKNLDKTHSIKPIETTIKVFDPIKLVEKKSYNSVIFEFAGLVAPGESGVAVFTESEASRLSWHDHLPGRCQEYK